MKRIRPHLPLLALFTAFALLLMLAMHTSVAVAAAYPTPSLRYAGLDGDTAAEARRYAARAAQTDEAALWPTFWAEQTARVESGLFSTSASLLFVDGDAHLPYPSKLAAGRLPGALETDTAAVTKDLAWALWGSHEVTGLTFTVNGADYTVTGVLENSGSFAILGSAGKAPAGGWQGVELPGADRAAAESFAAASGLGTPTAIVGSAIPGIAAALAWLPLCVLALYALVGGLRMLRLPRAAKQLLVFCLLVGFAALLPGLLAALPGWVLPSRWSDFSHWASVATTLTGHLRAWMRMAPSLKDAEAGMLLLRQGVLFAASLPLLWPLCRKSGLRPKAQPEAGPMLLPAGSVKELAL